MVNTKKLPEKRCMGYDTDIKHSCILNMGHERKHWWK